MCSIFIYEERGTGACLLNYVEKICFSWRYLSRHMTVNQSMVAYYHSPPLFAHNLHTFQFLILEAEEDIS